MTSQAWKQIIAIHIMPNISRSKGSQTMKYGQLIEYNKRNIFLKNHTQNVVEKLFHDPFINHQHWTDLWINTLKYKPFLSSHKT